jgi:hypothetical protein
MEVSSHLHTPGTFIMEKEPQILIEEEDSCASESVWRSWKRHKCLALAEN